MFKAFVQPIRFYLVSGVLTLAFLGIISRLYHLHIVQHDRLSEIVEENRTNVRTLYGRRGNIVDMQGNLLASTRGVYEIGVDPHSVDLEKDLEKLPLLAELLNVAVAELKTAFTNKTRNVNVEGGVRLRPIKWKKLTENADEQKLREVKALDIAGVYGSRKFQRYYPSKSLASHVLGFINKEDTPIMGIERYMDFYLAGQNGWRETERDGRRRELVQFRSREVLPRDGMHVELTIDGVIQHMVEEVLSGIVGQHKPKSATIIVSEPGTGNLLALANYPTYDPNAFWEYPLDFHRNRAVTDILEPGSTFKVITAASAINEKIVAPQDRFDCSLDKVRHRGRDLRLPGDHHQYGKLTVREIIVKSSNRGAAFLGVLLGENKLYEYASNFGFGEPTGYGPDLEENGILHPVEDWDGLTITRMPMGHAIGATPMQIHSAISVIANEGIYIRPRLVRRVFDDNGDTDIRFESRPVRRVITARTALLVSDILKEVVSDKGTARRAKIPGFNVAGKTGTTQKIIDGRYSSGHHIASFVGFFPATNPRLIISVFVDDAQTVGPAYGGVVAAPAFREIGKGIIRYMGIQPITGKKQYVSIKEDYLDWAN